MYSCTSERNISAFTLLHISDYLDYSCHFSSLTLSYFHRLLFFVTVSQVDLEGAQWLSGRVLDSRPKGRGFEPHRRHCVVVLEQDTFILA